MPPADAEMDDSTHWLLELKKDRDELIPVSVQDGAGNPISFAGSSLIFEPHGESPVILTAANGKWTMPAAGQFLLTLSRAEISGYDWSEASLCWRVIYTDGRVDNSFVTGRVTVSEAC